MLTSRLSRSNSRDATRNMPRSGDVVDADPDLLKLEAMNMFVMSMDSLFGSRMDQTIALGWSDRPPMFPTGRADNLTLKEMCRRGVPPAMRCAVWISSIVKVSEPEESPKFADEYGTLGKVRVLEHGWETALKEVFPDSSDELNATIPNFGLPYDDIELVVTSHHRHPNGSSVAESGRKSLRRVLCTVSHVLGVEYAPMLPDLAALFLTHMPEGYAYSALREILKENDRYVATSRLDYVSHCRTFAGIMRRMYPRIAEEMELNGALTPMGLRPIFHHIFITVLRYEHVLRIMDTFTIEGHPAIFRIGVTLIRMYKTMYSGVVVPSIEQWWSQLRSFAHSNRFSVDELIQRSNEPNGSRLRRRIQFPSRSLLDTMLTENYAWAQDNLPLRKMVSSARAVGFVEGDVPFVLAKPSPVRTCLANWLPQALQSSTKLELIYSSDVHGRTLELFYRHCSRSNHTVMLIELLGEKGHVIGMYASQAWHVSAKPYGDGECFMFRVSPDPVAYKWKPVTTSPRKNHSYSHISSFGNNNQQENGYINPSRSKEGEEEEQEENKQAALMRMFMYSREKFISMGGNIDGSSGLRLNEDLSRGLSTKAFGFENEPFGTNGDFEVGLVEVYQLVRAVDGGVINAVEDHGWRL